MRPLNFWYFWDFNFALKKWQKFPLKKCPKKGRFISHKNLTLESNFFSRNWWFFQKTDCRPKISSSKLHTPESQTLNQPLFPPLFIFSRVSKWNMITCPATIYSEGKPSTFKMRVQWRGESVEELKPQRAKEEFYTCEKTAPPQTSEPNRDIDTQQK